MPRLKRGGRVQRVTLGAIAEESGRASAVELAAIGPDLRHLES